MDAQKKYPFHELFLKKEWSYATGAVLLTALAIALVIVTGKAWGVTGPFAMWGGLVLDQFGVNVDAWESFKATPVSSYKFWMDNTAITDLGIVIGALLAVLLAAQFKIKKIKSGRQVVAAVIGGLLMGIGARMALGCNIGAMFSALPAFSLHGWVFFVCIFIGAAVGSQFLKKYFI